MFLMSLPGSFVFCATNFTDSVSCVTIPYDRFFLKQSAIFSNKHKLIRISFVIISITIQKYLHTAVTLKNLKWWHYNEGLSGLLHCTWELPSSVWSMYPQIVFFCNISDQRNRLPNDTEVPLMSKSTCSQINERWSIVNTLHARWYHQILHVQQTSLK